MAFMPIMPTLPVHQSRAASHSTASTPSACSRGVYSSVLMPLLPRRVVPVGGIVRARHVQVHCQLHAVCHGDGHILDEADAVFGGELDHAFLSYLQNANIDTKRQARERSDVARRREYKKNRGTGPRLSGEESKAGLASIGRSHNL